MVLDQTLKAIAHFLVRPKDVHASAVGKDDLGGVRATVRSLYLHDVSRVEQCGAGACFKFDEHVCGHSTEDGAGPAETPRLNYSMVTQINIAIAQNRRQRATHGSNTFSCCEDIVGHPLAICLAKLSHRFA
jgi:hypothetical protein